MKRIVLLLMTFALTYARADAAPLAILTDVSGAVQVVRAGKVTAGKNGTQLQAKDRVRVAKGAATIYYATRAPQSLKSGQQVEVAASGATPRAPSVWRNVYAGLSQGFARRRDAVPATMRPGGVVALWPVNTKIAETKPQFAWALNGLSTQSILDYWLTLKDARGAIVWEGAVNETVFDYPAALQPNTEYLWNVAPRQEGALGEAEINPEWATPFVSFRVATPGESTAVRAQMAQLTQELKISSPTLQRTAQATIWQQGGFRAAATAALLPETTHEIIKQGQYFSTLDAALARRSETERLLLRTLWIDANQGVLANKIVLTP